MDGGIDLRDDFPIVMLIEGKRGTGKSTLVKEIC